MTARLPASSPVPESSRAEHLELMLEMSAVGIWELDVVSGAAWRNLQHDRIFGYDELLSEWTYDRFLDHVVPEDRPAVDLRYGGAIDAHRPWSFECRIRRADGEVRWISATGRPIRGAGGETRKLIGHVIDVTHTKRNEERLRVLLDELNHRVRNTLTVVQAIAARSFQDHVDLAQGRADFLSRLDALAAAHSLLTDRGWTNATLPDVVERTLLPYRQPGAPEVPDRFDVSGPEVRIAPEQAVSLTMALNELATNALKHGALRGSGGRVELTWTRTPLPADRVTEQAAGAGEQVDMLWRERGGPPVRPRQRTGFGMTLLERLMPADLGGRVEVALAPEGLTCRIAFNVLPVDVEVPASR